jgi:ribonuclease P protein component
VLSAEHRLRRSAEITEVIRRGRRAAGPPGHPVVVVHVQTQSEDATPARVAFAVPRSVGPAVTRNRVRRRLRHLMAIRVDALPAGTRVVVRALPAAAGAGTGQLGEGLDRALRRAGEDRRAPRAQEVRP